MKLTYVVSMFPCWSETFILNELLSHNQSGVDIDIFSIKKCNETMVHEEAKSFIQCTTYSRSFFDPYLWFLHIILIATALPTYFKVLTKLIFLKSTNRSIKIKALAIFALAPSFIVAARQNKTTHLHAHFATYPALLAWIIGQFTKIPFTFTAHAHDIYFNQDLLPIISSDAAAIVTISEFNKQFIVQKIGERYENKINVIHCGIDLNRFIYNPLMTFNYSGNKLFSILSIGRLSGIKGFTYLIEALRLLKNDGINFKCNIIGDGPLKTQLSQQVEDSGLSGNIIFLGSKKSDEIPDYLKSSDVFILACATDKIEVHDGIPVVFMEAMAYGTPVIGTRLSGIPELIKHSETGLCANPEDSVSLKDTIQKLIKEQDRLPELTKKARELIENEFNIETNGLELRTLFQNIQNNTQ